MTTRRAIVERADRLDRLAKTAYGSERGGTVEALLSANPPLALFAEEVPAGTVLIVPVIVEETTSTLTRPWL